MVRESVVENYLHQRVKALGGWTYKIAPTTAGLPDRMVVLPGGRILLVELKRDDGRLSAVQTVLHEKLASLGVHVFTLYGKCDVDDFLLLC